MKLNIDCIRDILIYLEDSLTGINYGNQVKFICLKSYGGFLSNYCGIVDYHDTKEIAVSFLYLNKITNCYADCVLTTVCICFLILLYIVTPRAGELLRNVNTALNC